MDLILNSSYLKEINLTESSHLTNIEKYYRIINRSLKIILIIMPEITGMSARDAVYVLESNGFRVRLEGSGSVSGVTDKLEKTIVAGQKLVKGKFNKNHSR